MSIQLFQKTVGAQIINFFIAFGHYEFLHVKQCNSTVTVIISALY